MSFPSGSISSINNDVSIQEKQMQDFAKHMLVGRLFIGTFHEKRYVDPLKSYRDVIVISQEETELIRDVETVRKRILNYYTVDHWVGITTPDMIGAPASYCLWVELPEEVFGSYWYKISRVKFSKNETLIRLKIVRPITNIDNSPLPYKPHKNVTDSKCKNISFDNLKNDVNTSVADFGDHLKNIVTAHNSYEALKFMCLLLIALSAGLLKAVEFLGNFTIKLMQECSHFVRSMTPIIIACINLIAKIIGGFYLLILSMWRDRNGGKVVYNSPYVNRPVSGHAYDQYNTVYYRRALPPPQRNVTITPLD